MSIHDIAHKIKGRVGDDRSMLYNIAIIVVVGIFAFWLGRLSNSDKNTDKSSQESIVISNNSPTLNKNNQLKSNSSDNSVDTVEKGKYVASKNGKLYYTLSCAGVKRIKEENKVYFDTAQDAEKIGLTRSASCK